MTTLRLLSLTLLPILGSLPARAEADWQVVKTFQIGGEGAWDYVTVDPSTHQLYVTRTTHTMVIDSATGKTIADIPGQKNAHGVALVPGMNRGFISDGGGDGAIVIFDLKTNETLGTIAAQPDADGIIFDPVSGKVLVVSGDNGVLMSFNPDIDPKNGKIDEPIALDGKPEFLAADPGGKIYVNLVDKNEVAVVNLGTRKVVGRWPVAPGGAPVGMAIDATKGQLLIGCRKPAKLIVMSTRNGKVMADLPIGEGVDATQHDGDEAFASCRDGALVVSRETSPGKFAIAQTVKIPVGARTMGLDPTTHTLYLPTAEFDPPTSAKGRPRPKPNSFKIVVVAQH